MFDMCRCDKPASSISAQENLINARPTESAGVNSIYTFKRPKLLINRLEPDIQCGKSIELDFYDKIGLGQKRGALDSFLKIGLMPPSRKESDKAESTNLSNNCIDASRFNLMSSRQNSVLALPDKIPLENLEVDRNLNDGDCLRRNYFSKTGSFSKFAKKYGTENMFSDFVEFRECLKSRKVKKQQLNTMVHSRIPHNKVLSLKEYRKTNKERARTVSPKKPILSKKSRTLNRTQGFELSPVRKQVTFSKTNTILIFVKDDQLQKSIDHDHN